jgi:hypothetical protein
MTAPNSYRLIAASLATAIGRAQASSIERFVDSTGEPRKR